MKVSLKFTETKLSKRTILSMPDADKKVAKLNLPIPIRVLPSDNYYKTSYFTLTKEELVVRVDEQGYIDGRLLRLIANNANKIRRFIELICGYDHYNFYEKSLVKAYIWLADNFDKKTWSKSPYSESFYDSKQISWTHKPENSIRVSSHWNFNTFTEIENGVIDGKHCQTYNKNYTDRWAIGQFVNGKYRIIKKF